MSRKDKLIKKMKEQPNGIRMSEADSLFRQKGSHRIYENDASGDVITIKDDTPLKAVYVKDILKRIEED